MTRLQAAVGAGALALGIVVAWAILDGRAIDAPVRTVAIGAVVGWSFVGAGLAVRHRRPENTAGSAMIAVGFLWLLGGLGSSGNDVAHTVGLMFENVFILGLAYLLLAFPTGRLQSSFERLLIAAAVVVVIPMQIGWMLVDERDPACALCRDNLIAVAPNGGLELAIVTAQQATGAALSVVAVGLLVRRWRRGSRPFRRAATPVLAAGGATFAAIAFSVTNDALDNPLGDIEWMWWLVFATVPYAFLAGLVRLRLARGSVARLVVELERTPRPGHVRDALARALGDPSLQLAYWLPERGSFVDPEGRAVEVSGDATVVEREGRRIAALVHDPVLSDEPELLDSVCAAAGLTLENQRLQAELRARLEELRRSRARIVGAADAERRRIERNLHDGTQQRLVSVSMALGLAEARLGTDPAAAREILREVRASLSSALAELRELSQGIHPGILTERGLATAVSELAYRAPTPIEVSVDFDERPPEPVEAAAYYVVSESLANAAKHAHASAVSVRVGHDDGQVFVEVADDGVGGAEATGSGLSGLRDRVEALGGRFSLVSPTGRGTVVRAELPCA